MGKDYPAHIQSKVVHVEPTLPKCEQCGLREVREAGTLLCVECFSDAMKQRSK